MTCKGASYVTLLSTSLLLVACASSGAAWEPESPQWDPRMPTGASQDADDPQAPDDLDADRGRTDQDEGGAAGKVVAPWPMFRHDALHSGRSPYTGPQTPTVKWRFKTGGGVSSSPAVAADGTVYVGSKDGHLYAINPQGTLKWRYRTGSWVYSSPAVGAHGTIYVGSLDGCVYALNPDGKLRWKHRTGVMIVSSPTIGPDQRVYIGCRDGCLYVFGPDGKLDGKLAGAAFDSSPAIAGDGTVYSCTTRGLCAFFPDGTPRWIRPLGSWTLSSPAIGSDRTAYVSAEMTSFGESGGGPATPRDWADFCAVSRQGRLKWRYSVLPVTVVTHRAVTPSSRHERSASTSTSSGSSPAIGDDATVYFGCGDGCLYALTPGRVVRWRFATGDKITSSPAVDATGTVYVGSNDGCLYAINPNGTLKWFYKTGGWVTSSPAIGADGTIYVGSYDGYLYAFGDLPSEDDAEAADPEQVWDLERGDERDVRSEDS